MSQKETGITGALPPERTDETHYVHIGTEYGEDRPYIEMIFSAYQAGENSYTHELTGENVRCETLFDGYADTELCERFGINPVELLDFRIEQLGLKWVEPVLEDLHKEFEHVPEFMLIRGTVENVKKNVSKWLNAYAEDAAGVGGDDSYFDYYPDGFYVAHQLCPHLGLDTELRWATERAVELRYADDVEDCLGQSRYGL